MPGRADSYGARGRRRVERGTVGGPTRQRGEWPTQLMKAEVERAADSALAVRACNAALPRRPSGNDHVSG